MTNKTREEESLHERWLAFKDTTHLTEHWYWRPGWNENRSFYTWHLTFESAAALHQLVRQLQDELGTDSLDPVPAKGLHLTMQGVGFADEVAPTDLASIIEHAEQRLRLLSAFHLTLGPIDPDAEGIGLLIRPWSAVERVRLAVREAIADVWGADAVPEPLEGFRPHVTIAYSASDSSTEDLRRRMAPLRHTEPVTVTVCEAQLIQLRRHAREYRWDVVRSVPFGNHSVPLSSREDRTGNKPRTRYRT